VTALDSELRPEITAVAERLPSISDSPGKAWELRVDVATPPDVVLLCLEGSVTHCVCPAIGNPGGFSQSASSPH
jgi:hypothetical protein